MQAYPVFKQKITLVIEGEIRAFEVPFVNKECFQSSQKVEIDDAWLSVHQPPLGKSVPRSPWKHVLKISNSNREKQK